MLNLFKNITVMKKMILVAAALLGTSALSNAQHVHFSFVVNSGPSTVVVSSDPVPAVVPVPAVASPMLVTAPIYEASFVDLVTALALNSAQALLFEPIYRSYCHDVYYAPNPMALRSVYYDRFRPYLSPRQIEMVWGHPVAYHHYGHANPVFHFEPGWYYSHHGYKSHYGPAPHHAPAPGHAPAHQNAPVHHGTAPQHYPDQGYRSGNGYHPGNGNRQGNASGHNSNPGNHSGNGNVNRPSGNSNPGNHSGNGNVNRPSGNNGHSNVGNRTQTRFTTSRSAGNATRAAETKASGSNNSRARGTFGGRTSGRNATTETRNR